MGNGAKLLVQDPGAEGHVCELTGVSLKCIPGDMITVFVSCAPEESRR